MLFAKDQERFFVVLKRQFYSILSLTFYYNFNLKGTTDFSVSCHEKKEDGGGGEKIKIEENIPPSKWLNN